MTFLPVVGRELIAAARRRSTHRIRWGVAAGVSAVAMILILTTRHRAGGDNLLCVVGGGCLVMAALSGLFLTSDSISSERRDGTLGLLHLTTLGPLDVILGKLAGLGVNAACASLAVFPIATLALIMGGFTPAELYRYLLCDGVLMLVSLCVGLAVSAGTDNQGKAVGTTALILILLILVGALQNLLPEQISWIGHISPISSLRFAADLSFRPRPYWTSLLVSFATGIAFLGLAAKRLSKAWSSPLAGRRERQTDAPGQRQRRRLIPVDTKPGQLSVEGIRGLLESRHRAPTLARALALTPLAAFLVAYGFIGKAEEAALFHLGASAFVVFLLKGMFAWESVRWFAEARRTGGLELLLSSPVTDAEVYKAHSLSLQQSFRSPFVIVYLSDLGCGWMTSLQGQSGVFLMMSSVFGLVVTMTHWVALTAGGKYWGVSEASPTVAFGKNLFSCLILGYLLAGLCPIGVFAPLAIAAWLKRKADPSLRIRIQKL